jgi:hypothetical protein
MEIQAAEESVLSEKEEGGDSSHSSVFLSYYLFQQNCDDAIHALPQSVASVH